MNDQIDDLIDAWCDGVIDAAGQAELSRHIAMDGAVARHAAARFDQHRALRDLLHPRIMQPHIAVGPARQRTSARHRHISRRRRAVAAPSHRWAGVAAIAAMVVCAVLLAIRQQPAPAKNDVWLEIGGRIARDRDVEVGQVIAADGAMSVCFKDSTRLDLADGTRITLFGGTGKSLQLDRGSLRAQVAPQPSDAPLTIATPNAHLTVVGTIFRVEATSRGTALRVESGSVRMVGAGVDELVRSGVRRFIGGDDTLARPQQTTLISADAVWSYLDTGEPPPAAWTGLDFDASHWKQGPAPLGYDTDSTERPFATVIGTGAKPGSNRVSITSWFRRGFTITDPAGIRSLTVNLQRDDGAVLYLNGIEVARSGMPEGPITPNTAANSHARPEDERVHVLRLPPSALRPGTNCIAVEVHQTNRTSSDLLFALELIAETAGTTP